VTVRLKEGEALVGEWGQDVLRIGPATLRSGAIRKLARTGGGAQADLWDGGTVQGELGGGGIVLISSGREFRVGLDDLVELSSPGPELSGTERERMQRHIAKLGSPIWAERAEASRALREVADSGRAELERALASATEPEVRHRLQQLLGRD
jgi:hypothetical protein